MKTYSKTIKKGICVMTAAATLLSSGALPVLAAEPSQVPAEVSLKQVLTDTNTDAAAQVTTPSAADVTDGGQVNTPSVAGDPTDESDEGSVEDADDGTGGDTPTTPDTPDTPETPETPEDPKPEEPTEPEKPQKEEVKKGWDKDKTHYYKNGKAVKGVNKIGKKYYLFNSKGVLLKNGIQKYKSKIYLVNGSGVIKTGWQTYNGNVYYFSKKEKSIGQAKTGLRKIKKKYYLFDKNGVNLSGWQTYKNKKYYLQKSTGSVKNAYTLKGKQKVGNKYYIFAKKGNVTTGWQTYKNERYYLRTKGKNMGAAATGSFRISGKVYLFKKNGVQLTGFKETMAGKVYNLSSGTNYIIAVDKSNHKVCIFSGKKNHWFYTKSFTCTVGAAGTPTVEGKFSMGASQGRPFKQVYFDSGAARCWYASRIIRGYMFHSVLYNQTSSPSSLRDGRLGVNASHGCIRLAVENAKWIYTNIGAGTTAYIYH